MVQTGLMCNWADSLSVLSSLACFSPRLRSLTFLFVRTRRTWSPNVHRMKIVSDVLGRELTLQVSTSALRTFDKHGGMDRYLLRSRIDKLDQGLSRELRTACELSILNCQQQRQHRECSN